MNLRHSLYQYATALVRTGFGFKLLSGEKEERGKTGKGNGRGEPGDQATKLLARNGVVQILLMIPEAFGEFIAALEDQRYYIFFHLFSSQAMRRSCY